MAASSISSAESRVMAAVWNAAEAGRGGAGIDEILADAGPSNDWGEATVRTLIQRLIKKGALVSERRSGRVVYMPRVSRHDWLTSESQGLLDRLFGGQLAPLVAHFTKEKAISPADLARLKRLVAELDEDED